MWGILGSDSELTLNATGNAQSLQYYATEWMAAVQFPAEAGIFLFNGASGSVLRST
jgi:hypothetical protein